MKKLLILGMLCIFSVVSVQAAEAKNPERDFKQKQRIEHKKDFDKFEKKAEKKSHYKKKYDKKDFNKHNHKISHNKYVKKHNFNHKHKFNKKHHFSKKHNHKYYAKHQRHHHRTSFYR